MPLQLDSKISAENVCAVVLAGGRGLRMGGLDKGLQPFRGQPLVSHAVQRLQAQQPVAPGLIAINANRNLADYAQWGHPVWADATPNFDGPLAGIQTALHHAQSQPSATGPYSYLLVVPCDSPLFPLDLLQRLAQALNASQADIALAAIAEPNRHGDIVHRAQPVFCLLRTHLLDSLRDFMAIGGRKISAWTVQHATVEVAFNMPHDTPQHFFNANTLDQLQQLEQNVTLTAELVVGPST